MTTHTFSAFRATDIRNTLTLVDAASSVSFLFNHIGEAFSYSFQSNSDGLPPIALSPFPQQMIIDGKSYHSQSELEAIDFGRFEWGDDNQTDVMLIHLTKKEFLFITVAGDPVDISTTAQLRAFAKSLTAEDPILTGDLAENQSFSYTSFADHVSVTEDDTVTGTKGNDEFSLGTGNDVIHGLAGQDLISGEDGNDTIYGGDDQDYLYGGNGRDLLYGGTSGYATMYGSDQLYGGGGNDKLYGGPEFSDLHGDGGNDKLYLLEGNGIAYGGNGNDRIYLETELFGGVGEMQAYGGTGNDRIFGGNAADYLYGDEGNDVIKGGNRSDFIDGRDGNDRLFGGAQGDQVIGGAGNDLLLGQGGDDDLTGGSGADRLYGGKGKDTASYERSDAGVTASLSKPAKNAGDAEGDSYRSIENLNGTYYHDHLSGNGKKNVIHSFSGNDILYGGGGHDELTSDDGNNSLYGGGGNDTLQARGLGTNHYYGGGGKDEILDSSNGATAYGGRGKDYFDTGDGNDLIFGGAGVDEIYTGKGNDTVTGGGGADEFSFSKDRNDKLTITDFQDNTDSLRFEWDIVSDGKGGTYSARELIEKYAHDEDGNAVFDFKGGNLLVVEGITTDALLNDLEF